MNYVKDMNTSQNVRLFCIREPSMQLFTYRMYAGIHFLYAEGMIINVNLSLNY